MRISDGSSDVCSSDLGDPEARGEQEDERGVDIVDALPELRQRLVGHRWGSFARPRGILGMRRCARNPKRLTLTPFSSEECRVGKECGSKCRSRVWPHPQRKHTIENC